MRNLLACDRVKAVLLTPFTIMDKIRTIAKKKAHRSLPRVHGLRVYFTSIIIYYLLVTPFLLLLYVKNAEKMMPGRHVQRYENSRNVSDSLSDRHTDSIENSASNISKKDGSDTISGIMTVTGDSLNVATAANNQDADNGMAVGSSMGLQIKLLLIAIVAGMFVNYPFKRYFRIRRRGKQASYRLHALCKKWILKLPAIHSIILLVAFGIGHIFVLITLQNPDSYINEAARAYDRQFFYISLIASLLVVMFAFYWIRHRVHIKYLEHIYSNEEMHTRVFKSATGRIKNRLWITSGTTTLLPLLVVIIYLLQSFTSVSDLGFNLREAPEDVRRVLLGDQAAFGGIVRFDEGSSDSLFYVNAFNSLVMMIGIYSGIFVSLLYIFFFIKWNTEDLVFPVKELLANMKRTGEGAMNSYALVRTNDELGELTEGYNDMTRQISEYIGSINRINESYFRFVPRQFLDMLGKEAITDIQLGDQVQKEMSVLFTDIRDFTSMSEAMTLQENFDFINNYLGLMEPVISRNHGFIDKYMGDSIMALFSGKVENAINAAIEMRRTLNDYNQVRETEGKPPLNMGVGIHTGDLMLGVVGGHGRMEGTVISDAVNLASRLEGLTKIYSSAVIISQDTLIKLDDPFRYSYRFLDIVKVKGKKESVYIFEILDGESDEEKGLRMKTRADFNRGLELYRSKRFEDALEYFKAVVLGNPSDGAARLYQQRCITNLHQGIPEDWDGVEVINTK